MFIYIYTHVWMYVCSMHIHMRVFVYIDKSGRSVHGQFYVLFSSVEI